MATKRVHLPATYLMVSGVPKMNSGEENVLRITGIHGSGSREIYEALASIGVEDGAKNSVSIVNDLILRVKSIASPTMTVNERPSELFDEFPTEVTVEWVGELTGS